MDMQNIDEMTYHCLHIFASRILELHGGVSLVVYHNIHTLNLRYWGQTVGRLEEFNESPNISQSAFYADRKVTDIVDFYDLPDQLQVLHRGSGNQHTNRTRTGANSTGRQNIASWENMSQ